VTVLDLPALDKLDLRWNRVPDDHPMIGELRERGCLVHA